MANSIDPGARAEEESSSGARLGRVRWTICAMLFVATSINYMDRQVIAILKPTLMKPIAEHGIGMTDVGYGHIGAAFMIAYALGLIIAGRFVDKVGTRIGYMVIMAVWSLSAMGHALARTVLEFGIARFCLGLGESGNFPAAIKTVAEWFPQSERSLATGIFNSGANVGAILAPVIVPWVTISLRMARGVPSYRRLQRHVDCPLVHEVSQTCQTSHTDRRRIAAHLPGGCRADGPFNTMDQAVELPPDMGICYRQVSYGSHLVVLPFLVTRFFQQALSSRSISSWIAACHRLQRLGDR